MALLAGALLRSQRQIATLDARVDSLAITLTHLSRSLQRGAPRAAPTYATVATGTAVRTGSPTAPVAIVEFVDYQCPFCARYDSAVFPILQRDYIIPGLVQYFVRDFPLPIHAHAATAAAAARCVSQQDSQAYWRYRRALFANASQLDTARLAALAEGLGIRLDRFRSCLNSPQTLSAVQSDEAEARAAGLTGTPAFVVGRLASHGRVAGRVIVGAQPIDRFRQLIQMQLRAGGTR